MTKEEIVEELAEGIFQYSSSVEEIVKNTEYHIGRFFKGKFKKWFMIRCYPALLTRRNKRKL